MGDAKREYASLGARFGALTIDSFVIGLPIFASSFFLSDAFRQLGPWGRLVGLMIFMSYFGLGNSEAFGGQTLGKRYFNLRVCDRNGDNLSISSSFLRASVFLIPVTLNNAALPFWIMENFLLSTMLGIITFGGLISTIVFFLSNKPSRRLAHDFAAQSVVMRTAIHPTFEREFPKKPLATTAGLLVLCLAFLTSLRFLFPEFQSSTRPVLAKLDESEFIWGPQITGAMRTVKQAKDERTFGLGVSAWSYESESEFEKTSSQVAHELLEAMPHAQDHDVILISLKFGFDLGPINSSRFRSSQKTVLRWRNSPQPNEE